MKTAISEAIKAYSTACIRAHGRRKGGLAFDMGDLIFQRFDLRAPAPPQTYPELTFRSVKPPGSRAQPASRLATDAPASTWASE